MKPLTFAIFTGLLFTGLVNACTLDGGTDAAAGGAGGVGVPDAGRTNGATTNAGTTSAGTPSTGGMLTTAGSAAVESGGAPVTGGAPHESAGAGGESGPIGECRSGEQESCWALEDGTPIDSAMPQVAKGSCHIGQRFCGDDLKWGACLGAVGPKAKDSCEIAGNDDDCDGSPNHGCTCVDGAKRDCGTDTGTCVKGQQTCAVQAWGDCIGELKPQALDSCSTLGNDDNCNGKANEDCPCVGNKTESCGDCGSRQCSPGTRQWGGCQAVSTCPNNFACVSGTCSTSSCQAGYNGPCGGSCTKGCCSVNDCPERPNMGRSCNGSNQCTYSCKANYASCDGNDANGCEVNLITGTPNGFGVNNCGSCGNTCNFPNDPARGQCTTLANSCAFAECLASFKNPGDPTDANAYECLVTRPHAALKFGDCSIGCGYLCAPGYTDCNSYASDGCETLTTQQTGDCYTDPFWGGNF